MRLCIHNVYIIYDGHLENTLIPNIEGIKKEGKYKAYWDSADISTSEEAVEVLKDITNWSVFATGISGATATGSPTYEMLANSWNSNPMVNSTTLTVGSTINGITDSTRLYMLPMVTEEVCYGYWLSTALENNPYRVWYITFDGYIDNQGFGYNNFSIRPLVCLPTETTGMVEKNVTIFN